MGCFDGRRLKKRRRRQREFIENLADAFVKSEKSDRQPVSTLIDQEVMESVEREGLCSEASIEIFVNWYTLGGMNRGLTITEIMSMPKWLLKDIRYILGVISRTRQDIERADVALGKGKGKKSPGRKAR